MSGFAVFLKHLFSSSSEGNYLTYRSVMNGFSFPRVLHPILRHIEHQYIRDIHTIEWELSSRPLFHKKYFFRKCL